MTDYTADCTPAVCVCARASDSVCVVIVIKRVHVIVLTFIRTRFSLKKKCIKNKTPYL